MTSKVSTRQEYLVLVLATITFKIMVLPSLLMREAGRDGYFTVILGMILEIAMLAIFLFLSNRNPSLTFKEILQKIFGTVIQKIILLLYALYFFSKTIAVFISFYVYLNENLYSNLPWYVYAIPTIFVLFYVVRCGIKNITRLGEFFAPLIIISAIVCLFMGAISCDFTNALPLFEKGIGSTFSPLFNLSVWFGNFLVYIILFGNFKESKNHNKKILIWSAAAAVFVSIFYLIYNCIHGVNGAIYNNSLSDISSILSHNGEAGGVIWIIIMIWCLAIFLFMCISSFCASFCLKEAITNKRGWIIDLILTLGVLGCSYLLNFNVSQVAKIFIAYGKYLSLTVQYAIPLLLLIFSYRLKAVKHA